MHFEYLQWRLRHFTGLPLLCLCLLALRVQKCSLLFPGSLLCFNPLTLVLSLDAAENSLAQSVCLFFQVLRHIGEAPYPPLRLFSLDSATWPNQICSPSGKLNSYVLTGLWERDGLSIEFSVGGVVFTIIHDSWLVEKWFGLEKVLWKCSKRHISNLNISCDCK